MMRKKQPADGAACVVDASCCGGSTRDTAARQSADIDTKAMRAGDQQWQSLVAQVQVSCTLDPSSNSEALARWQTLFRVALDSQIGDSGANFTFKNSSELKAELEDLVKLERICCAHVLWLLEEVEDRLKLTLETEREALKPIVSGFMPQIDAEGVTV